MQRIHCLENQKIRITSRSFSQSYPQNQLYFAWRGMKPRQAPKGRAALSLLWKPQSFVPAASRRGNLGLYDDLEPENRHQSVSGLMPIE